MPNEPMLLDPSELPASFSYPGEFRRLVRLGLIELEPWLVLQGDRLRVRAKSLALRFPERSLVPFAEREDCDDVACWDLALGEGRVVIVHDFAEPGWERRDEYPDFHSWLRRAIEDFIERGDIDGAFEPA